MNALATSPRRLVALLAAVALAVGGIAVSVGTLADHTRTGTYQSLTDLADQCQEVLHTTGQPDACAHSDEAPPGVDVDEHVSTAELVSREGGAAEAVAAAEDEGVPVPAELAAASNTVPCDGDGTSGYRVQAMYVVASGSTNRYPDVVDSIKTWAAGVNTVFSLSAAKTGGTRDVRYVTATNGDSTCSPTVLNVTVPAGSFSTFDATIKAVQALGYTSAARKYLMWVDGTGQCGIASTYLSSGVGQDNPNNGSYAQYARIDTGCWGQPASVEAHELSHTLGSVQGDAPHATTAGHCFDESDRMCYVDGGTPKTMQQICPTDQEVLFDCNNDDYFSTFPVGGSYLATHWNTANSRFLIGGGDGSGGGQLGTPTKLGGTMTVNNPAIAGLPTQVAVNLEVPDGRTTTVAWTSKRRDCVFWPPTLEQTEVTCDAKSLSATTVTATVTDSTGEKIVRTIPLTFSTAARVVEPVMRLDGSGAPSYTACPSGKGVLTAIVFDATTRVPVKGISVTWSKTVNGKSSSAGSAVTDADGLASSKPVALAAATYSVKTTATKAIPSVTQAGTAVTFASGTCTTRLTSSVDDADVPAGDVVKVSGVLTRTTPGGPELPAAGEKVALYSQLSGATKWTSAGTAITGADGSYAISAKPVSSLTYQTRFVARTGFQAATSSDIAVKVTPRMTAVRADLSTDEVMAGSTVTVTGSLTQASGYAMVPLGSGKVTVTYPAPGGKTATASATSKSTGVFTIAIKPIVTGTVTVTYAGKPGWAAASDTADLTVNEWTSALTMTAVRGSTGTVTVSGKLMVTNDAGASVPKASAAIMVTYQATATTTRTVKATTKATGEFTISVKPLATGSVTAEYAGIPGYAEATATPVTITVP